MGSATFCVIVIYLTPFPISRWKARGVEHTRLFHRTRNLLYRFLDSSANICSMVVGKASTGHRVEVVKESHAWVPYCLDCDWVGSDSRLEELAVGDAHMHERGERHPWQAEEVVPWSPDMPMPRT